MTVIVCGPDATERRQLRSPYVSRMLADEQGEAKDQCRRRVADFILRHQCRRQPRIFSFPAAWWSWERMVQNERPDAKFVCVERNMTILQNGLPMMAGRQRCRISETTSAGTLHGYESERASILHAEMGVFVQMCSRSDGKQRRREWRNRFRNWTGAWLDFNGPMSREVQRVLPRIQAHTDMHVTEVPIAVTVLAARERDVVGNAIDLAGGRPGCVAEYLNGSKYGRFELVEHFIYHSAEGTPMLTVMGLIRNEAASPPEIGGAS